MESALALAIRGAINQGGTMLYFLITTILLWIAAIFLYRFAMNQPGDDIGLGILAWGLIFVSVIESFIYAAVAIWLHRFI